MNVCWKKVNYVKTIPMLTQYILLWCHQHIVSIIISILNIQHIVINLMTYLCMLCQCWSYFFHWTNIDKMSNILVLYQCHFKTCCYNITLTSYQWLYQHWMLNILLRCCKSTHTKRGQVCDVQPKPRWKAWKMPLFCGMIRTWLYVNSCEALTHSPYR